MTSESLDRENPWERFYGPNLGYMNERYEQYKKDPDAVEDEVKALFQRWGAPPVSTDSTVHAGDTTATAASEADMEKVVSAVKLASSIRTYGHLAANIHPLEEELDSHLLELERYELTEADLEAIPARVVWPQAPEDLDNGLEAIRRLREIYTKSLAYEFSHVFDTEERKWLNRMVESGSFNTGLSTEEKTDLLDRLTDVTSFEDFLNRTFVGQKRFSIEGVDSLVPMLDEVIQNGIYDGARNVMIGMAHRGRLNVLAHILGKPYEAIFSEFQAAPNKELVPSEGSMGINFGWTGDVKYHLGARRAIKKEETVRARLTLANNPSHLEFVDPVVEGYARAAQEDREKPGFPDQNISNALPILIHGDAAFPGEGIVAETLNLSRLPGYQTGGALHIITNNLLGFTTRSTDARSTRYASDLAKGFEIPIVHVNADNPEACIAAINLAYQYRKRFEKDFLIDLIGYRRYGHNEMDDPAATQPQLYSKIDEHPNVRELYAEELKSQGVVNDEQVQQMEDEVIERLRNVYENISESGEGEEVHEMEPPDTVAERLPLVDTAVPLDKLRQLNDDLLEWPEGFNVYGKLKRILERRRTVFDEGKKVDWATAETLALATVIADGTPVRLTGQDTERGTFAQRHLVLHDSENGDTYSPLHVIPQAKAAFSIYNSPLSEASVLGFEYGYNVLAPGTLTLWEAQYGDFANSGQVIFDQFISAGRAKWGQQSSLVMLLPHGYEGQGPEHSSARLERFLQLAAENNWTVANLTTAAQYFHVLRRQAAITGRDEMRPLVIMTPKSLIRNQHVASEGTAFSQGQFQPIVGQTGTGVDPDRVERLVMCSGKVAIDLEEKLEDEEETADGVHIVRIEQLYPFPMDEIESMMDRYPHLKEIVWVQEEPKNMGAWNFMEPRIKAAAADKVPVSYIGRPRRSSPAGGKPDVHKKEQERIVTEALKPVKSNILTR